MRWISKHVNVKQLCHVDCARFNLFLFKLGADKGTFFCNDCTFFCRRFARSDGPFCGLASDAAQNELDEVLESQHANCILNFFEKCFHRLGYLVVSGCLTRRP